MTDIPLTKFEKARLIGIRATQIANGANSTLSLVDIKSMHDPIKIAEEELKQGKIPIVIIRTLPNGEKIRVKVGAET